MSSYDTSQFLLTKFIRPRLHTTSLNRPRLHDALNRGRPKKLSLVSGPAGSGKSTLLSDWLSEVNVRAAWLSLDPYDDEPRRFLAYLTQALSEIAPDIPADAANLLASSREIDIDAFLHNLVLPALHNNTQEGILVIDDVHLLEHRIAKKILKTVIHQKPSLLHIALASRTEPDLGLVALRAKAQLNEIRSTDLRFQEDEAFVFYNNVLKLELDVPQVAAIESQTEGWIAACQLAGLRLKGRNELCADPARLLNDSTWVADYLIEEVIQQLSPTVREFLFTTSILDRMCDSLCAELVGSGRPTVSLRSLEQDNLFVHALDEQGCWYRYHSVLGEFLRNRLKSTEKKRLPRLHRVASLWLAANNFFQEAMEHAILAEDTQFLSHLLEKHYLHIISNSQVPIVRRGLNALGAQVLSERPKLALADTWCTFYLDSDPDKFDSSLNRVQTALSDHRETVSERARVIIESNINMLHALNAIRLGDYREAIQIAEPIEANLPRSLIKLSAPLNQIIGTSYLALGDFDKAYTPLNGAEHLGLASKNFLVALSAIANKAVIHHMRLNVNRTRHICTSALRIAQEKGYSLLPIVGTLHVELGLCYFYQGKYEAAMNELEQGIQRYSLAKHNQDVATAYCFLARLKLRVGDADGANRALQESLKAAKQSGSLDNSRFVLSYRALLDLQQGRLDRAKEWLRDNPPDQVSNVVYREHIHLVRVTIGLLSGAFEQVLDETKVLIHRNRDRGFFLYALILEIIRVVALTRAGLVEQAAEELSRTARIAMTEEVKVYFQAWGPEVEWSSDIRGLLDKVKDVEVRGFLASLVDDTGHDPAHSKEASSAYLEQPQGQESVDHVLTNREVEVLGFISRGMSNHEIAKKLFVSLPTVKTHVYNIFRKLEVKNRTGAIRVARQRGICREA